MLNWPYFLCFCSGKVLLYDRRMKSFTMNKWNIFNSKVSKQHENEFNAELIDINFVRSRNLGLLLLSVFSALLVVDYFNYKEGLWAETPGLKLLFGSHLLLTVVLFCLLIYAWLITINPGMGTSRHKQLFVIPFTFILLTGASLVSVADQYIHGEITVYILCLLLLAIVNYQKPLLNSAMYGFAHAIFLIGVTAGQTNPALLKAHCINGSILVILSIFVSRILYAAKVKEFNSLKTIEHQNRKLENANAELSTINHELQDSLMALDESQNIIFSLTLTLESKDINTHGHSERVAEYVLAMAKYLNLSDKDRINLWRAAILHDIGKIGIPDAILNKPSALDQREWEIMRSHPECGEIICSKLKFAQEILPIIRSHHERFGGNGYPDGLKGEEIPFLSRIVSVADTVDAMTSPRNYRTKPRTMDQAIEELKRCSGTQFDPVIVDAFIKVYEANGIATPGLNRRILWS